MSVLSEAIDKQIRIASKQFPEQRLVMFRGDEIGLIEKWKGDCPWQSYYPIGMASKLVGSFRGPGSRIRARNCVLEAAGLLTPTNS